MGLRHRRGRGRRHDRSAGGRVESRSSPFGLHSPGDNGVLDGLNPRRRRKEIVRKYDCELFFERDEDPQCRQRVPSPDPTQVFARLGLARPGHHACDDLANSVVDITSGGIRVDGWPFAGRVAACRRHQVSKGHFAPGGHDGSCKENGAVRVKW